MCRSRYHLPCHVRLSPNLIKAVALAYVAARNYGARALPLGLQCRFNEQLYSLICVLYEQLRCLVVSLELLETNFDVRVSRSNMPLTGNTPNLFIKPTPWEELRATLLGRRVEVFQADSKPEQWRKGLVASQGLDPDKHPEARKEVPADDSQVEVGWLVAFDDGEVQWVRYLRGTPYVRFLSNVSVLASAEDGGSRTLSRQSRDGTPEAFNFGFGQDSRSSVIRPKGTDHENSTSGPRFRADTVSFLSWLRWRRGDWDT